MCSQYLSSQDTSTYSSISSLLHPRHLHFLSFAMCSIFSFPSLVPSLLQLFPFLPIPPFFIFIPIPQFFHFCLPPFVLAHCSGVGCEDSRLFVVLRKHLLTLETSSLALDRWEPSLLPAGTVSCLLPKPQWQLPGSDVETSSPLHQLLGPSSNPPGAEEDEVDGQRRPQLNSVKTPSSPLDFAEIGRSGSRAKHYQALPADSCRRTEVEQLTVWETKEEKQWQNQTSALK